MDSKIRKTVVGWGPCSETDAVPAQRYAYVIGSERSSPLPDPAEIARRAERQRSLYEEAAENPDRVVPAMFIEDCARCETLADKRRREGLL